MDFVQIGQLLMVSIMTPLIVSLVPSVTEGLKYIFTQIILKRCCRSSVIERRIESEEFYGSGFWHTDPHCRNASLIKALLHQLQKKSASLDGLDTTTSGKLDLDAEDVQLRGVDMQEFLKLHLRLKPADEILLTNDVTIRMDEQLTMGENVKKTTRRFTVLTLQFKGQTKKKKDAMKILDTVVADAYMAYITDLFGSTRDRPFVYTPIAVVPTDNNAIVFDRYGFQTCKTFDKLFFTGKERVLKLVDDLQAKRITKLGLFLYGRPGCGKTSVAKAIMAYTNRRALITVKLANIRNDAELISLLQSETLVYRNSNPLMASNQYIKCPPHDRIYLLEDVDADSFVLASRDDKKAPPKENNKKTSPSSTLTMSGVLNALDGVVELNQTIIIITTNKPERIDEAVTRYGRVQLKLEMGPLTQVDALKLVQLYFPQFQGPIQDNLTPCYLEAMCQAATSMDDLSKQFL